MKTIAFTIDESSLKALDQFLAGQPHSKNRSQLIRQAVQEFLERRALLERERKEWAVWSGQIEKINAQAAALVEEQSEP